MINRTPKAPHQAPARGAQRRHRVAKAFALSGLLVASMAGTDVALGGNIIVNAGFEASGGAWPPVAPVDWSYYGPGQNFYINSDQYAHSGGNYFKIWGTEWTTGAAGTTGVYQDQPALASSVFSADAWFFTLNTDAMGNDNAAWMEISFRDAGGNMLSLYKTAPFGVAYGVDTWFHLGVTNVCDINPATGFAVTGSVAQIVAPAGTKFVRTQLVHYQINNGGGSAYIDDVNLNQVSGPEPPAIGAMVPGNMLLASAAAGVSFTVASPSSTTINSSDIHMTVNGTDVTASLGITGTAASKNVTYTGLITNQFYAVSITATDTLGLAASAAMTFDTLAPVFVWEAEDYDFTNGMYIQDPIISSTPDLPNSYFGKTGTAEVDFHDASAASGDHLYRPNDAMATTLANDTARAKFVGAAAPDYKIGWFNPGEWVNWTRNYPPGLYNVYARLAGGQGAASATLSTVTAGQTTDLGTFSFNGTNWNAFYYIPLTDTNANLIAVTLGGLQTLRLTTAGGADASFIMLVPAQTNYPRLSDMYPTGSHPFEPTNTLSFNVTSPNATIAPAGIQLKLNGMDVSSGLVVGGTPAARSVTFPHLVDNAIYTAIVKVTDVNGLSIGRTNHFDTFSQANYMVEMEDFDFDGGAYVDNPAVWAYLGKDGVPGIDFSHATAAGEQFAFRGIGLPTEASSDYLRQKFLDMPGTVDYNLGWFGYPDWGNYTRDYPAGNYRVYGRFAGSGGYSMYLDKVLSGTGTVNQVTQRLGRWGAVGRDWQLYDWVPLTDEGLAYPIVVPLGGVTTLRVTTTGNCNPNYIMLVPESGIQVASAQAGNNLVLSIPTQVGVVYRVFTRTDITAGNWTLLTTVAGDGSVKTVTDTITGSQRFYRVVAP